MKSLFKLMFLIVIFFPLTGCEKDNDMIQSSSSTSMTTTATTADITDNDILIEIFLYDGFDQETLEYTGKQALERNTLDFSGTSAIAIGYSVSGLADNCYNYVYLDGKSIGSGTGTSSSSIRDFFFEDGTKDPALTPGVHEVMAVQYPEEKDYFEPNLKEAVAAKMVQFEVK